MSVNISPIADKWRTAASIFLAAALAAVSNGAWSSESHASAPIESRTFHFSIEAKKLDAVLTDFSATTKLQIIYDSALVTSRHSNGLLGNYTARQAIGNILAGTGLIARFVGETSVTIVDDAPGAEIILLGALEVDAARPAMRRKNFEIYGRVVQAAVMNRLGALPSVRYAEFDFELRLWIGSRGQIDRVSIEDFDKASRLQDTVAEHLSSLDVGTAPPNDMPQPVRLRVGARMLRTTNYSPE